jgi:protoheme IX farnesyltransferase
MINKPGYNLKAWLEFSKLKIMIPVSLTGFTGYFAFNPHFTSGVFILSFGVLMMAIAASALNQIQEVELDQKMTRTCKRPLPSERITINQALLFFLFNLIIGALAIYYAGNLKALIIGFLTLIWYNGVYTYSKRMTAFAVVPGALTGALPPLIGWVAAGGGVWEKPIVFIQFLIFIGQIPHFWLLILKYGEEYKHAGLPSLTDIFNGIQIKWLTFSWVAASVVAALFLCYFEIIKNPVIIVILIVISGYIIWQFLDLLKNQADNMNYKRYSIFLDSYFLLVLLLLISDKIIS